MSDTAALDRPAVPLSDPENDPAHSTLILFAFLWAVFTLFHQAKPGFWARTPIESLQTVAAIAVLFRPSSIPIFLSLVIFQLVDLVFTLPRITNHSIVALLIDLTIVFAALIHSFRNRGAPLSGAGLFRLFAPAARVQVIILYLFVVLHKLNGNFFDPRMSCAVDHTQHLARMLARVTRVNLLPSMEIVQTVLIGLTIAAEIAIPLLLLLPRTRLPGIAAGLIFHYVLGVNIFHDFSGMMYALLLLFAPVNFAALSREGWNESVIRSWVKRAGSLFPRSIPVEVWITVGTVTVLLITRNQWQALRPLFLIVFAAYGLVLMGGFGAVTLTQGSRFRYERGIFALNWAFFPIIGLMVLNGLCPYLGLKTENSFAMFSNLRTEGGSTNHLFIPISAQIFGFQRDMVRIVDSSDPWLRYVKERGASITFFTLREHLSQTRRTGKKTELTWDRGGVRKHVQVAEADPELAADWPWLYRKLLVFREVDAEDRQQCVH